MSPQAPQVRTSAAVARWILHESGWLFPTDGAPAARLEVAGLPVISITWTARKALCFEGTGEEDGDTYVERLIVPFEVLRELVWRSERWHWRRPGPSPTTTAGRHK